MAPALLQQKSSLDTAAIFQAERAYHETKSKALKSKRGGGGVVSGDVIIASAPSTVSGGGSDVGGGGNGWNARKRRNKKLKQQSQLLTDISDIRKNISDTLNSSQPYDDSLDNMAALAKLTSIEAELKELRKLPQEIQKLTKEVSALLAKLEKGTGSGDAHSAAASHKSAPKAPAKDDDDVDLFGSDSEDEDAKKAREELVKAHLDKKSKKPTVVAKSMIILDVKPWDDETDVTQMEKSVRSIEMDGLLWGTSKFVEIAYGIKKLQITCVVEDDKVSVDQLEESITGFEDLVQSIDIVAFNKI